jgi:hypothetical protein
MAAVGATAIAEIQFADYIFPAFDQVCNPLFIMLQWLIVRLSMKRPSIDIDQETSSMWVLSRFARLMVQSATVASITRKVLKPISATHLV